MSLRPAEDGDEADDEEKEDAGGKADLSGDGVFVSLPARPGPAAEDRLPGLPEAEPLRPGSWEISLPNPGFFPKLKRLLF